MELAIGIVVFAVLCGLTILSYGQHETFRKIALPLYWAALLTLLGLAGEYLDPDKATEAQAVAASLVTPWWVMICMLGFIAYLFFLLFLPMILGTHKKR